MNKQTETDLQAQRENRRLPEGRAFGALSEGAGEGKKCKSVVTEQWR